MRNIVLFQRSVHPKTNMLRIILFCVIALATSISGRAQSELSVQDEESTQANQVDSSGRPKKVATNLKNDVNNDGVVNAIDVVDIVKYVKGSPRSKFDKSKADVNADGVIDMKDAESLSTNLVTVEPASGQGTDPGNDPGTGTDPGNNPGTGTDPGDNPGTGTDPGDDPGTDVGGGLNIEGGTLVNPGFK